MSSATGLTTKVTSLARNASSHALTLRPPDKDASLAKFEELVRALSSVGLATEVRNGEDNSVLVFCRVASKDHLFGEVYRSRCASHSTPAFFFLLTSLQGQGLDPRYPRFRTTSRNTPGPRG